MQQTLEALTSTTDPWPLRRQRAQELLGRLPFATEILTFYGALLEVQARAFRAARGTKPPPQDLPAYAATRVLPAVIDVTVNAGPRLLSQTATELFCTADLEAVIGGWLRSAEQRPVETFLARASAGPVLEAMGEAAGFACKGPRDERHCPNCGGLPQLSYFAVSGEALVTGPRYLICARCGQHWIFSRMTCAGCGESSGPRLPVYAERERFPHVRIDGCETCHQYLLTFDVRKETRAVPIVDELAALPLDLYAQERGMTKIVPNLMGN